MLVSLEKRKLLKTELGKKSEFDCSENGKVSDRQCKHIQKILFFISWLCSLLRLV